MKVSAYYFTGMLADRLAFAFAFPLRFLTRCFGILLPVVFRRWCFSHFIEKMKCQDKVKEYQQKRLIDIQMFWSEKDVWFHSSD